MNPWQSCFESLPDNPGDYIVTTSKLYEGKMHFDGKKWSLIHPWDHVIWWKDEAKISS